MKFNNREMKIGTIINHINDNTINLIPPFQRGTVWNLATRQKLISNMVQARPIPARRQDFSASKLATDQPQFYTLVTTLLATDLMQKYSGADLTRRLLAFSKTSDAAAGGPAPRGRLKEVVQEYRELSAKQTTHPSRRERRQEMLVKAIELL
jgi:hypothetical protein